MPPSFDARLVVICPGRINPLNGVLSVCSRWCAGQQILWPREVPLEKKSDIKYMQVNVLRNTARMTKIGGNIQTDKIHRQCPDALGM